MDVMCVVARAQTRLRAADGLWAVAAGALAGSAVTVTGAVVSGLPHASAATGAAGALVIAAAGLRRAWRLWTPSAAADAIEARVPGLDNLVVTAVELAGAPGRSTLRMRQLVAEQANRRAADVTLERVAPLVRPAALAALAALGTAGIMSAALRAPVPVSDAVAGVVTPGISALRIVVTPPAYLGAETQIHDEATTLTVRAGSTLRVEVAATTAIAWVQDASHGLRTMTREPSGRFVAEWVPGPTTTVVIAAGESAGVALDSRLLPILVSPDQPPRVRIAAPARDLAFGSAKQVVAVRVEAEDDVRLEALELRYTRLSGSGEAFSFTEGRVPIQVDRGAEANWVGEAQWSLAALGLDDGDALVYRAVARDTNPDGEWASSDSYTIDIGRRLEFASAGFALPEEDRRYAISQQMVIVKTERLHAERPRLSPDAWTEQTRLLAMEQRMVRAEVVFLSGGEVEDEVEEAAHAHELQEGRLENQGRAEMLRAIADMSRAEARLIGGDTAGALVFERSALAALQRAFDRRRYFLRTLPERARIDPSRRLSGDRRPAASFDRPVADADGDPLRDERALMEDLAVVAATGEAARPAVVARLAAFDPQSPEWRDAAARLAAADTSEGRKAAAVEAMNLVAARARQALAPPAVVNLSRAPGALRGWWADESRPGRQR